MVSVDQQITHLIQVIVERWNLSDEDVLSTLDEHLPEWRTQESRVAKAALTAWGRSGQSPWDYVVQADILWQQHRDAEAKRDPSAGL